MNANNMLIEIRILNDYIFKRISVVVVLFSVIISDVVHRIKVELSNACVLRIA